MRIIIMTLAGMYGLGAALVFTAHIVWLPMVTPALALVRALVWPIFWATGWPHGSPLPMD
jgi:hypothetical protein